MNCYIQMKEKTNSLHETEKETTAIDKMDNKTFFKKIPSFILKAVLLCILLFLVQKVCLIVGDFFLSFLSH